VNNSDRLTGGEKRRKRTGLVSTHAFHSLRSGFPMRAATSSLPISMGTRCLPMA
jgi:hypothetical protein